MKLILGSASPRRKQLLHAIYPSVEVRLKNVDEDFSPDLKAAEIPSFLSGKKSKAFDGELKAGEVLVTADTIVWFDGHVMNKPSGPEEALFMLKKLRGNTHQVFTGVCIASSRERKIFSVESKVKFFSAVDATLDKYIREYRPFDKAGSYGAQECLPENFNPLSEKEKKFLASVGQPDLFEKSLAVKNEAKVPLIERIEGSYFNVMGLPVVELYEVLKSEFKFQ